MSVPSLPPIDTSSGIHGNHEVTVPPELPPRSPNESYGTFTPHHEVIKPDADTSNDEIPPRLPKRPTSKPSDGPHSPKPKFGMRRASIDEFEMASPILQQKHSKFPHGDNALFEGMKPDVSFDYESKRTMKFLLHSRKHQVEHAISSIDTNYLISNDEYLTKLHSNDVYIELMSEIDSGLFDNPDKTTLYSLVLKTLKIQDSIAGSSDANDAAINELASKIEKMEIEEYNDLIKDLLTVLKLTGQTTINPLIISIQNELQLFKVTSILSLIFETSVLNSDKFKYLLVRTMESYDIRKLITLYEEHENPFNLMSSLLSSDQFWVRLVNKLIESKQLTKLIDQIIIYGFTSIVDTIVLYLIEADSLITDISINASIATYNSEFNRLVDQPTVMTEILENDDLARQKGNLHKLTKELKHKKKKYEELSNNYKQLNTERDTDETIIRNLKARNGELLKEYNAQNSKLNGLLANFDVIQQNNDKNLEISKMNDALRGDIGRLTDQIIAMKMKLKKK